jgi:hypothetical protein
VNNGYDNAVSIQQSQQQQPQPSPSEVEPSAFHAYDPADVPSATRPLINGFNGRRERQGGRLLTEWQNTQTTESENRESHE